MSRTRRALAALLCVAAGTAAAALGLEFSLRLLHRWLPRDFKVVWIRSQLMRDHRLHRFDKEVLWLPTPDLSLAYPDSRYRWRLKHIPYPNDPTAGYRGDAPASPPVDLLVLGDSYTYGFEVDQDQTWVERLKRATGVKAVNLAVTSYGTAQEAGVYRLYGAQFKPRAVLQVIATNDPLDDIFFREVNARKDPKVVGLCWFLGAPQGSLPCRAALWAMRSTVAGGIAVFELQAYLKRRGSDDELMRRGTGMICDDVRAVHAQARAQGARYGVALIGLWNIPRLNGLKETLHACLRREGVPFVQLDDAHEARVRRTRFIGRFDWHWNDAGHAYVAQNVEAFLRAQRWLGRPAP